VRRQYARVTRARLCAVSAVIDSVRSQAVTGDHVTRAWELEYRDRHKSTRDSHENSSLALAQECRAILFFVSFTIETWTKPRGNDRDQGIVREWTVLVPCTFRVHSAIFVFKGRILHGMIQEWLQASFVFGATVAERTSDRRVTFDRTKMPWILYNRSYIKRNVCFLGAMCARATPHERLR